MPQALPKSIDQTEALLASADYIADRSLATALYLALAGSVLAAWLNYWLLSRVGAVNLLIMGLVGYVLERRGVPVGPVVLGIILGGPLEERFIQAMTASRGSLLVFVSRPAAAALGLAAVTVWLLPAWTAWRGRGGRPTGRLDLPATGH